MANLSNVHDLFFPSPPPLADLACIQIGLDLWRQEINAHRTSDNKLRERDPRKNTSLTNIFPNLPSRILSMIQPYAQKIGLSIGHWLNQHVKFKILGFEFLNKFCDFSIEFDGNIDYARTAKRIVSCDDVSDEIKFRIACWYCLEDDVVRLWPSMRRHMRTNINFYLTYPHVAYWVNKMRGIAYDRLQPATFVLDALYDNFKYSHWSAVKYFWNKLDWAAQRQSMINLFPPPRTYTSKNKREKFFLRYVLANLNEEELKICVNKFGDRLILSSPYIIRTWTLIKNAMTEYAFGDLALKILQPLYNLNSSEWCEVWTTAPNHIKIPVVTQIATGRSLFRLFSLDRVSFDYFQEESRAKFLLIVLSEASSEDRTIFWENNHTEIINRKIAPKHLRSLMDLCFSDESKKNRFKKEFISSRPDVMNRCFQLLKKGYLSELEDELALWCPGQESTEGFEICKRNSTKFSCTAINDVRLHLLHDNFHVTDELLRKAGLLREFIDNAFNNPELALSFKDKLLVGSRHCYKTMECLNRGCFRDVMEFVDLFASSEEIANEIKKDSITPGLRAVLEECCDNFYLDEDFENFIPWLLGGNDKILEFKNTLKIDAIVRDLILRKRPLSYNENGVDFDWFRRCFRNVKPTESHLMKFLKWYFASPELFDEFTRKYAGNRFFIRLMY